MTVWSTTMTLIAVAANEKAPAIHSVNPFSPWISKRNFQLRLMRKVEMFNKYSAKNSVHFLCAAISEKAPRNIFTFIGLNIFQIFRPRCTHKRAETWLGKQCNQYEKPTHFHPIQFSQTRKWTAANKFARRVLFIQRGRHWLGSCMCVRVYELKVFD